MEKDEVNRILQAIRELSEKVDQNRSSIQKLSEKTDQNHVKLTKRMDNRQDKMDYIQHKLTEHDEEIYKLKRKAQ
ncbi:hypothetical protein [Gracilibacillus kekensis]|uniref:hypothetical protein n=1 Tax=Gracilibacillus kekensis TaxID=1027249 RepID=UPI0009324F9E|nr:hypothetical protein [Gracilibacillus kekensis]